MTDWINDFLDWVSEEEPPYMYKLWTAISTLASVLQRKCYVNIGSRRWYPNFYVILIGNPASRKSTSIEYSTELLSHVGIRLSQNAGSKEALLLDVTECPPATFIDEEGRNQEHRSQTILLSELTSLTRHKDSDFMTWLQDWYDCPDQWIYGVISREQKPALNLWINLLGATTPDQLSKALPEEMIGGGLTSRMILVFERKKGQLQLARRGAYSLLNKKMSNLTIGLSRIHAMSGLFDPTDEVYDLWNAVRLESEDSPPIKSRKFEYYCERRHVHLIKLAMIISAATRSDQRITKTEFLRALDILKMTEIKMPLALETMGVSDVAQLLIRIKSMLRVHGELSVHKLLNEFELELATMGTSNKKVLASLITSLEESGFARFDPERQVVVKNQ